ncbi:unnamed protein product [Pedinophyceae sp. YPF-701]|nr:unnamed protein product [Pedinophyceae sp. YPF-701]
MLCGAQGLVIPPTHEERVAERERLRQQIAALRPGDHESLAKVLEPRSLGAEKMAGRVRTALEVAIQHEPALQQRLLRLGFAIIDARMSKCFQRCRIQWRSYEGKQEECELVLNAAMSTIKSMASKQLRSKRMPRVDLEYSDPMAGPWFDELQREREEAQRSQKWRATQAAMQGGPTLEQVVARFVDEEQDRDDWARAADQPRHWGWQHPPSLMRGLGLEARSGGLFRDIPMEVLVNMGSGALARERRVRMRAAREERLRRRRAAQSTQEGADRDDDDD